MGTLWIKTKGEKGEDGFEALDLKAAVERFIKHRDHWDRICKSRHDAPYVFTAKFETEAGIVPWKDIKKLL